MEVPLSSPSMEHYVLVDVVEKEIDVEDVEDGELDVGDLVCYTWAVGWLGRSSEHSVEQNA